VVPVQVTSPNNEWEIGGCVEDGLILTRRDMAEAVAAAEVEVEEEVEVEVEETEETEVEVEETEETDTVVLHHRH
jgi:hypothetical protein